LGDLLDDQGEALLAVKLESGIMPAPQPKPSRCILSHFGRAMKKGRG